MALKSGFFNAILTAGVYDRTYNAKDYTDCFEVFFSDGVRRSNDDDFKVVANGLNLSLNTGFALIKGHYAHNTSTYTLPPVVPPQGGTRIDRVVLRLDQSITTRNISVVYLEGGAEPPALTRNEVIYDICLAEITSTAGSSNVSVVDTRGDASICGWVYSTAGDGSFFTSLDNQFYEWFNDAKNTLASVTLFKRYKWEDTLATATSTVTFNIPQYDADTCFFEVYVNGMLTEDYTAVNNVLTFGGELNAGTVVTVYAYKSIDGTGIMDVADEITELQNEYATISGAAKYIYVATGSNDNVSLSEIAAAFNAKEYTAADVTQATDDFLTALGGNEFLAALSDDAHITVDVVGKLGVSTPVLGSGTEISPYRWFDLGGSMNVVFDFAKADMISVECAVDTFNVIFDGADNRIRNCYLKATGTATVQITSGGDFDKCHFDVTAANGVIGINSGTFNECDITVKSSLGNAIIFSPASADLIRVHGGNYKVYHAAQNMTSAVFQILGTETNAVIFGHDINSPTSAPSGYVNGYLAIAYAGNVIIDRVTTMRNSVGDYFTITNIINVSK